MNRSQVLMAFDLHDISDDQRKSIEVLRLKYLELALFVADNCPSSADRTVAIRKLRESFSAASQSIVMNGAI